MVYNGYYKVMSNIPKMGQLPTPGLWLTHRYFDASPATALAKRVFPVPGGPTNLGGDSAEDSWPFFGDQNVVCFWGWETVGTKCFGT